MCPGVRLAHVLISAHSPKPTAKPIGIAVSGVLSVGQYVLEPIEKNAATLCGSDRSAPNPIYRTESGGRFAAPWRRSRCVGDAIGVPRINQDANRGQCFARKIGQLLKLDFDFPTVEWVIAMCHEVGPRLSVSHQVLSSATNGWAPKGLDATKCHLAGRKCHQVGPCNDLLRPRHIGEIEPLHPKGSCQ